MLNDVGFDEGHIVERDGERTGFATRGLGSSGRRGRRSGAPFRRRALREHVELTVLRCILQISSAAIECLEFARCSQRSRRPRPGATIGRRPATSVATASARTPDTTGGCFESDRRIGNLLLRVVLPDRRVAAATPVALSHLTHQIVERGQHFLLIDGAVAEAVDRALHQPRAGASVAYFVSWNSGTTGSRVPCTVITGNEMSPDGE